MIEKNRQWMKIITAAIVLVPLCSIAAGPTLYGEIHLSVNYLDNNADYNSWSLNSNASRLGIKGSEELGNGMKVGYLIEWSVGMDGSRNAAAADNAKDLNLRNRAVTVSGDWGTLLAGQWDTPFKLLGKKVAMFAERLGDHRDLNTAKIDLRTPNTLTYTTPNMAGFSLTGAYIFDATTDGTPATADNTDYSAWSANAMYNNGPFLLGLAYENIAADVFAANADNQHSWRVAGAWAMGAFRILGTYTATENGYGLKNNDPDITTLGASWSFGNNILKGEYGWRSAESYASTDDIEVDSTGAKQWVIGLDHALSRSTTLYTEYGMMYNDDQSDSNVWKYTGNSAQGSEGEDNRGFGVGLIHKF